MFRTPERPAIDHGGFLCARRDVPSMAEMCEKGFVFPLRTQRCSLGLCEFHVFLYVSSAHAEMFRGHRRQTVDIARFLCARRDVPILLVHAAGRSEFPLRTQRCSARAVNDVGGLLVSSAHAEMFPIRTRGGSRSSRFLCARRDVPDRRRIVARLLKFPLRTQRCSVDQARDPRIRRVSSAHAEMFPGVIKAVF